MRGRRCRLAWQLLSQGIAIAIDHCIAELFDQAGATFAIFVFAVGKNTFERSRSRAGLGAIDVFFDLLIKGKFNVEPVAFGHAYHGSVRATQNSFGVIQRLIVIAQGCDDLQGQFVTGILPGCAIQQPIDFIIALGFAMADLGCAAQNFVIDQLAQQTGFFKGGNFDMTDFTGDIAFFVGQE